MRPLDRLPSIKVKLGVIIVGAVAGTTAALLAGVEAGLGWLFSILVAAVVGLSSIQLLARGMTSPLREMAAAAGAMAKGDYSRRVRATSQDEVGELARAFNKMATDLAEADRMRRDLVANVSHELRTPITALQALLENLVDGVGPADPATLETMLVQVHRLNRLVDQLLDLSKLESGVVPLHVERFEIGPLLAQAIRETEVHMSHWHESDLRFQVDVDPEGLIGMGDPERVHQVVTNLLDNAARHAPAGSTVDVRARSQDGEVVLEVSDKGPGIAPEEATRVFERFYRSDSSRSLNSGGYGLGLSIARWIVDLHGGSIRVEQNRPSGCRMVVTFPRR